MTLLVTGSLSPAFSALAETVKSPEQFQSNELEKEASS